MLSVNHHGLHRWTIGERSILHEDSHFGAFERYSLYFPAFRAGGAVDPGPIDTVTIDECTRTVIHKHHAAIVSQRWDVSGPHSILGTITIQPAYADALKVWGFSRLHFELDGITEIYPRITPGEMQRLNSGAFFPSIHCRVGGHAWIKARDTSIYVRLSGECAKRRHLLYWEQYSPTRYALHAIFLWPLDTEPAEVEIELSTTPFRLPVYAVDQPVTSGRPIVMVVRAMAEHVSESNPFGYVNVRLDDREQAVAWITQLADNAKAARAYGIIGWPWGYTGSFGLQGGSHEYPYNAFDVPEPLRSNLSVMAGIWRERSRGKFGALYRPMYSVSNGQRCWRFGDRTAVHSMLKDFEPFGAEVMYFDDCGIDLFSGTLTLPTVGDFIHLLREARKAGQQGIWFVEHPSSATLPHAGGYITVEPDANGTLQPNLGPLQWQLLRQMFPRASWLVGWLRPWADEALVQRQVIDWCRQQGGNVSPLVKDYLLTPELAKSLT